MYYLGGNMLYPASCINSPKESIPFEIPCHLKEKTACGMGEVGM